MKLKGIPKLDKMLTEFLEKFGCTAEMGKEFCYWHDDELINYTLVVSTFSDKIWKEYVYKTFNYKIENIFIFSLLHEVGHHFTMDNFPEFCKNKEEKMVEKIEKALSESNSEILDKKLNLEYFNLPMERTATKWAVRYAKKHKFELRRFWKKFRKELHKFYKINNVK